MQHAVCGGLGRPLNMIVTTGEVSDCIGTRALPGSLLNVEKLLGGRGYVADGFREEPKDKGIGVCIHGRKRRKTEVRHEKR